MALSWSAAAEDVRGPVVPGLHGKHPLTERQVGEVLIGELRCAACHEGVSKVGMKEAPDLREAGSRVTAGYLECFIADPAGVQPGTTMPHMLGELSAEEREEISISIGHYLLSLKGEEIAAEKIEADGEVGRKLFHESGCVACHSPRDEAGFETDEDGVVALGHVGGKYRPGALERFLHDPLKVRPSGRMPDMKLSKEEAAALGVYLRGGRTMREEKKGSEEQVKEGRKLFESYNCQSCHQTEAEHRKLEVVGPALGEMDDQKGCLSVKPGKAPNFHLEEGQRKAIRVALKGEGAEVSDGERVKMRLTQMNCIACHERDDYGGVSEEIDGFFHSTEEALGNEARIPPPLTLAGAKLRPAWMNKVLFDGESVRPYMTTRMPQFGREALEGLPELFTKCDKMEEVVMAPPNRQEGPMIRNGGHLLAGDKGLNCIACHNYNEKESPGMKGLDLMTSYQRLQPAWFYNYMKNPGKFRPGIVMPSYWPDGKAVQTEILDGDTHEQLRALWHQFSLGRSARDPSGLRSEDHKLEVTDTVRTYRGRSGVAGYRGIAVGFPGGMNYAFNAQNGALTAIWAGEFVKVGWRGQGSGNFNPVGKAVQLAQDVGVLQLKDEDAPWPLRPIRTKENPVNPDPRYPRQHGYAFGGYELGENGTPTFRYRMGAIAIEDRSVALEVDGQTILRRELRLSAASPQTLYFRALTGEIEEVSSSTFKTKSLQLVLPVKSGVERKSPDEKVGEELILKFDVSKEPRTWVIDYVLL